MLYLNCSYDTKYITVQGTANTRVGLRPDHKAGTPSNFVIL